jgi:peptidoglycan hydrolase-like protein with peptidoglycan-binding domain
MFLGFLIIEEKILGFCMHYLKNTALFLILFIPIISCATKEIVYKPGLPISIKANLSSQGIRVGEFKNNLGFKDPKKITTAMSLSRNVSEIIQNALIKELDNFGINNTRGKIMITGDIERLDPLKTPEPVTKIVYSVTDLEQRVIVNEFICESAPSARKIEEAIKDCMTQFFSASDVQRALGWQRNTVDEDVAGISSSPSSLISSDKFADSKTIQFVQQELNRRGYKAGLCDGILGENTKRALIQFKKDCGLALNSQIDDRVLNFIKNPYLIDDTMKPRIYIDGSRGVKVVSERKEFEKISGYITDESIVKSIQIVDRFNGRSEAEALNENGEFTVSVPLKHKKNEIVISATDEHGNQEQKAIKIIKKHEMVSAPLPSIKLSPNRYFALLIAVADYSDDEIEDLDYAIIDAQRLKRVFEKKYTFKPTNIQFLKNPKYSEIIDEFDHLSKKLTSKDNLLIFYGGHGYWDEQFEQGYWLPSDARKNSKARWLSNSTIRDFVKGIKTKHTLLITDSCFAGGIFKTRNALKPDRAIDELYKFPSRKAITSGMMTEVPDKSVFMKYLLKRLNNNSEKYLTSEELFASFKIAVINNSPMRQIPKFGEIHSTGDEGGDFIFVLNK